MNRKIAVAVGLGVGFGLLLVGVRCFKNGTFLDKDRESESIEYNDGIFDEKAIATAYENAGNLSIEKVIRKVVMDDSGDSNTYYEDYLMSDVDLENGTDFSENYSDALQTEFLDENAVDKKSFVDLFGFDYRGLNGREIKDRILTDNGFVLDYKSAVLDEEEKKMSDIEVYELENQGTVFEKLLAGEEYDSINEQRITCQFSENADGVKIPDYYYAQVSFVKGNATTIKTLYLQVGINDKMEIPILGSEAGYETEI